MVYTKTELKNMRPYEDVNELAMTLLTNYTLYWRKDNFLTIDQKSDLRCKQSYPQIYFLLALAIV